MTATISGSGTVYEVGPGKKKIKLGTTDSLDLRMEPLRHFPASALDDIEKPFRLGTINVTMNLSIDSMSRAAQRVFIPGIKRLDNLRWQAKQKGRPGWKHLTT